RNPVQHPGLARPAVALLAVVGDPGDVLADDLDQPLVGRDVGGDAAAGQLDVERGVVGRVEDDLVAAGGEPLDVQLVGQSGVGARPFDGVDHWARPTAVDSRL